jgi:hypothetical protein
MVTVPLSALELVLAATE